MCVLGFLEISQMEDNITMNRRQVIFDGRRLLVRSINGVELQSSITGLGT